MAGGRAAPRLRTAAAGRLFVAVPRASIVRFASRLGKSSRDPPTRIAR
jgi:hypothetical protein